MYLLIVAGKEIHKNICSRMRVAKLLEQLLEGAALLLSPGASTDVVARIPAKEAEAAYRALATLLTRMLNTGGP